MSPPLASFIPSHLPVRTSGEDHIADLITTSNFHAALATHGTGLRTRGGGLASHLGRGGTWGHPLVVAAESPLPPPPAATTAPTQGTSPAIPIPLAGLPGIPTPTPAAACACVPEEAAVSAPAPAAIPTGEGGLSYECLERAAWMGMARAYVLLRRVEDAQLCLPQGAPLEGAHEVAVPDLLAEVEKGKDLACWA